MSTPSREWWVYVYADGVGYIGTVMETTEELARVAALSKYSKNGERRKMTKVLQMRRPEIMFIFDDDHFEVRP